MSFEQINLVGPGKKATLITRSEAKTSVEPGQTPLVNRLQVPEQLPILLAGPVVRTVTTSSVTIWMATSVDVIMRCAITKVDDGSLVAFGQAVSTKLGEKLFLNLTTAAGTFPRNQLLAYNFEIILATNDGVTGFDGDVLLNPGEVALDNLPLPTFFIPRQEGSHHFLHGSCRKLHGDGLDAMGPMESLLQNSARNLAVRPANLFLTGDQIYADDVHAAVLSGAALLGRSLLGFDEAIPGIAPKTAERAAGTRNIVRTFGFTVDDGVSANHLLGFGEYASVYILSWNPDIWNWDRFRNVPAFRGVAGRFASTAIRRVLANIACYMQFDDHEITDDWFLNATWMRDTANPTARLIIANGLAAFWAFQASGNPLGGRDSALRGAIVSYLNGRGADPTTFAAAVLGYHDWHYTAPSVPPVVVLDTRTMREFPAVRPGNPVAAFNPPPALMNGRALAQFGLSIQQLGGAAEEPLVIVSPAPFLGYAKIEELQRLQANLGSTKNPINPESDPEAWGFNDRGFAEFLRILHASGRRRVVILSGDVHYGFTGLAESTRRVSGQEQSLTLIQCTASAFRNEPGGSIVLVNTDDTNHHTVGFGNSAGEFSFVGVGLFRELLRLGASSIWEFQLRWRYPRMGGDTIVATNNFGSVTVDNTSLTHLLISPGSRQTTTAKWADIAGTVPAVATLNPKP